MAWSSLTRAAFLRPELPIKYTAKPTGSRPYNTKVTNAPSTLPLLLVASAMAIIKAT